MSTTYTPSELARIQASVDSRRVGPFSRSVIIPEDTPQDDLGDLDGAEIIDGVPLWFPPEEAEFPEPDMPDEEMDLEADDETDDENDLPTGNIIPSATDEHMWNLYRHHYLSNPASHSVTPTGHNVIPGTQREMQGIPVYAREIRNEAHNEAHSGGTIRRRNEPLRARTSQLSRPYTPSELQRIQSNNERRRIPPGRYPEVIPPETLPWYQQIHEEEEGEPLYDDEQEDDEQEDDGHVDTDEEIIEDYNEIPDLETLHDTYSRNFANARPATHRVTSRGYNIIPGTQQEMQNMPTDAREIRHEIIRNIQRRTDGGAIYNPNNDPEIAAQNEVIRRNMQGGEVKKKILKRQAPTLVQLTPEQQAIYDLQKERTAKADEDFKNITDAKTLGKLYGREQGGTKGQRRHLAANDRIIANVELAHKKDAAVQKAQRDKKAERDATKKRRSTACDLRGYSKLKKADLVGALKRKLTAEKMPDNIGKLSVIKLRALAREYCGYKKVSRK